MSIPPTRALLLAETETQRIALVDLLGSMSREQFLWPGAYWRSAKDQVAHLAEWERLFMGWWDAGVRGENPPVPAEGYTWATEHDLNQVIFERHRDEPPEHVMADWADTSRRFLVLAQSISDVDLFMPGRYAWTGRGTVASFVYECGANHYRWSATEIKRGLKFRR